MFGTTAGPPPPSPTPPGSFAFAAMGDAPYSISEELRSRVVRRDLEQHDLAFVLSVGDIFWLPCSDERYRQALDEFNALSHPVVYTPGDNEWTDCWEPRAGAYVPLERLRRLRGLFFSDPGRSLGRRHLPLTSQAEQKPFREFVEHARWTYGGVLFVTVHVPGSWNGREKFPGRTAEDDEAARRRTAAAVAWLAEAFEAARADRALAVVVAFHASPAIDQPPGSAYRQSFEPFLTRLEEEIGQFTRPVLVIHGDDHEYVVDRPFVDRATGRSLNHVTRMEVPGSPDVGWVRVLVRPGTGEPFGFEKRVVPRWKHW